MNKDTAIFISYNLWMITLIKYVNNFQIAKIQSQGDV